MTSNTPVAALDHEMWETGIDEAVRRPIRNARDVSDTVMEQTLTQAETAEMTVAGRVVWIARMV